MMQTPLTTWHTVTTAVGNSTGRYRGDILPLQGIGQGNGAGPAIWAVISAVLLTVMRNSGIRMNLVTALSFCAIVLTGFAFVDDMDLLHAAPNSSSRAEDLIPQMKKVMDTCEGLLHATGGALRDDKSYWYFLDYKFQQGCWKYKTKQDIPVDIDIKVVDARGNTLPTREILTRLEPSEACETLGVYVAMDGNWSKQAEIWITKAMQYGTLLRTSHAERDLTWYILHTSFMKLLEYPMEAACLSNDQWNGIMKPLMGTVCNAAALRQPSPETCFLPSSNTKGWERAIHIINRKSNTLVF
jgi:hypothetical protein